MKRNGAQIVIESLIKNGADVVFGYPGGAVLNIYDELYKNADRIHHVITAHEQGAAHAADGYARASGKVGAVIATSGPGATNLVTGIATAHLDSVPMVAITGNVATPLLGKDSFQEVDIVGITMPVTKHNYIVRDVSELEEIIDEAFMIAKSGRPGPVLIDIPKDVQAQEYEYSGAEPKKPTLDAQADKAAIASAAEMIAASEKPYIYCGGGVTTSGAGDELTELARRIDAPIGTSMMGLSAVPQSDNGNLGMVGMHGKYASSKAKSEADLIIAVGTRFSDRATGDKAAYTSKAKFIHIDIDPAEVDKNIAANIALVGDIKATLKELNAAIDKQCLGKKNPGWRGEVDEYLQTQRSYDKDSGAVTAKNVIEMVRRFCGNDTVVATDVGQHQIWVAQHYRFEKPRTHLTSGGLGTMGFGMGAAIGGCFASNMKKTVLFTGDGSFGMNLNELATAVSQNLPLVVVIMNNGVLGMVRQWQKAFYDGRYSSTTLNRKTDFVKLAEAFGAKGYRASDMQGLHDAVKSAFEADGPVVLDCMIDMDDRVLPMIPPGGSIKDIIVE